MNTTNRQPQPLVSMATRAAVAFAVVACVAGAWGGAQRASHHAVENTTAALAGPVQYVTLERVVVVGHRDDAPATVASRGTTGAAL